MEVLISKFTELTLDFKSKERYLFGFFLLISLRKEALASATNAVAQVQNMSDRISTILNTPAPDDDAELRRLFHSREMLKEQKSK